MISTHHSAGSSPTFPPRPPPLILHPVTPEGVLVPRIVILSLALLAVAAPRATPADDKKFVYPLTVGTVWTYRVGETRYDIKPTKREKPRGDKVDGARLEMIVDGKTRSFEHIAVEPNGIFRHAFEDKPATPPIE